MVGGVIIGNALNIDEANNHKNIWTAPAVLSMINLFETTPNHQASFFPTEVIKQRPYNTIYRMLGDLDLFMYCLIKKNVPYAHLNYLVVDYYLGGFSSTNADLYFQEKQDILNHYLPERVIIDYEEMVRPKSRFGRRYAYLKKYSHSMTLFAGYILELMALPIRLRNYLKVKL